MWADGVAIGPFRAGRARAEAGEGRGERGLGWEVLMEWSRGAK